MLAGWNQRKKHTLTGSVAGAQVQYQLRFEVHYGAGVDAGAVVYCDSQCKVDFGDIRFTKADGETELDYWIQQQVNSDVAYIWVEVDSIPVSPNTVDIYLYYGNAAAATTSNFTNTWLESDDYSSDPVIIRNNGGPLNHYSLSSWNIADRALANHRFEFDIRIYAHQYDAFGCLPRMGVYWSTAGADAFTLDGIMLPDDTDLVEGNFYQTWVGPGSADTGVAWVENVWYVVSLKFDDVYKLDLWRKDAEAFVVQDDAENYDAQTITNMGVGWYAGGGAPGTVSYDAVNDWIDAKPSRNPGYAYWYIDNFRVGTYCDPEPANTSWGLAETSQDLYAQFEVAQGTEDLYAQFEVAQGTEDLYAQFEVRQDSENLFGLFFVRNAGEANLAAEFIVRQKTSADLLGRFEVGQDSEDLFGEFVVRHEVGINLFAVFEVKTSVDLFGEFIVRHIGTVNLTAEFVIKQWQEDLHGKFLIRREASLDLPSEFIVRHEAALSLPAEFVVAQGWEDLPGEFVVRRSGPVPWLGGWRYRKTHTLTGSTAGTQTNYQMGVKVYYGAGADGTEVIGGVTFGKVYCNSKCKTDFSDIRFTNGDGTTLLDYWLQEKVDSDYAIFWVEVDSIPFSPNTVDIYVYYGNPSATYTDAQQHGKDTFIIFDDFPGVALDGQWIVDANITVTVAGGILTCKATADSWSTWHGIHMALANVQGIRLESYGVSWAHVANDLWQFASMLGVNWANQALGHRLSDSHAASWEANLTYIHDDAALPKGDIDGEEPVDLIEQRDQNGVVKFFKDGVEQSVGGETSSDSFDTVMIIVNRLTTYPCPNLYLDRILARSFVDPEPTHTAWGSEAEVSLLAKFNVRQIGTPINLYAEFTVAQSSEDLLGEFVVRREASENLLAGFTINPFIAASEDLLGAFVVKHAGTEELLGVFDVRQEASIDLAASFEGQVTEDLLGLFDVRQEASEDLLGIFDVRQEASVDLLGEFSVRQITSADLPAEFEVGQGAEDLPGEFVIRRSATLNLAGAFVVRHTATADLAAEFIIQQAGTSDLRSFFWVNYYSVDLLAGFNVRQTSSRATDFKIIDNTRGLTIEDVDREMTVTPRRRMRVK